MKEVTVYQAEDGTQFETEDKCLRHEKESEFEKWYNSGNELQVNIELHNDVIHTEIEFYQINDWLKEHEEIILKRLKNNT